MGLIVHGAEGAAEPTPWLVQGLFPIGYISLVAAREGTGKTALLASLALQMTRPEGLFLGRPVDHGASVYVNFDAPSDGKMIRRFLQAGRVRFPDAELNAVDILEPDHETYVLGQEDFSTIRARVIERGARMVIFDAYMSLFPLGSPSKAEVVMVPMTWLRRLAYDLQVAVILVDHMPKPAPGERPLARGAFGSVAKMAQARSVHLLRRVREPSTRGRHVVDWSVHKNTFAPAPEPFAVEFDFSNGGLAIDLVDLPGAGDERPGAVAKRAMHNALVESRGDLVTRRTLLDAGSEAAGVSERTAETELRSLLEDLGSDLETRVLPGPGAPKAYRLLLRSRPAESGARIAPSGKESITTQSGIVLAKSALREMTSRDAMREDLFVKAPIVKGEL